MANLLSGMMGFRARHSCHAHTSIWLLWRINSRYYVNFGQHIRWVVYSLLIESFELAIIFTVIIMLIFELLKLATQILSPYCLIRRRMSFGLVSSIW